MKTKDELSGKTKRKYRDHMVPDEADISCPHTVVLLRHLTLTLNGNYKIKVLGAVKRAKALD